LQPILKLHRGGFQRAHLPPRCTEVMFLDEVGGVLYHRRIGKPPLGVGAAVDWMGQCLQPVLGPTGGEALGRVGEA
jgi:hypothetical protein